MSTNTAKMSQILVCQMLLSLNLHARVGCAKKHVCSMVKMIVSGNVTNIINVVKQI